MSDRDYYTALSHAPIREAGNEVNLSVYRSLGKAEGGAFKYMAPAEGLVQVGGATTILEEGRENRLVQ